MYMACEMVMAGCPTAASASVIIILFYWFFDSKLLTYKSTTGLADIIYRVFSKEKIYGKEEKQM